MYGEKTHLEIHVYPLLNEDVTGLIVHLRYRGDEMIL